MQVVQSQLSLAPDIGMPLADEAFDGSGSGSLSGRDPDMDDDVGDDEDGHEASGSGMFPPTTLGINFKPSLFKLCGLELSFFGLYQYGSLIFNSLDLLLH